MSKEAFVTLATNDTYGVGALVLGRSLRRVATSKQTVVLVTRDVSEKMKQELGLVFNLVVTVDPLDSGDAAHLALMSRPELGITFTKLHAWRLVQFSKCVFLDADTLVVQNCDELFERDELSAAPDPGWPDCFNSGVFVFVPSEETFKALLDFAVAHGSFDGGDQGLLNMFFSDWATGDIRKHLPFIYNVVSSATYSYLPALKYFGSQVKIAHFLGSNKPWMRQGQLGTPSPYQRAWWSIFREDVASRLSQDMAGVAGVLAREEPDDWRREAWEAGDVDYLGRDSFDNIWKRICECVGITAQTLSAPAAPAATSAGIANQPSAPTAAAEKPMQPASEKVVGAAPAEKPTASSEKPKEPVASAEKLAEPAVFAEKPTESVASAEKPGEPAISAEKPADPVMSVEKPPEPVILEKKSEEPVASIETPAETVTPGEKPSEPIVSGEKPVESAISAEKTAVSMVSAEKPPEPAVQKSAEPVVSAEKPAEPVVSTEKPAEPTVPGEKPAEIGVPSEKAAETALSVEKPTEPALPAEKPGELGLSAEKPAEPAVSAEKPAEPVVSAGKQAELTVSADKPSDPSSAAAPLPDKLPETAPVAVESPGIVDKEKKAESSAKVEKQESPKAVEIPTEKTSVEEKCIKQVEKPLETPETAKPVETQTKSTAIEKPKESADNVLKETETMPTEKKAEPALTSGKTVEVASTGENLAKKPVTPSTENVKPTGTVEVCPMKPSEHSGEARIQPPLVGGDAPVCKKEPGTPTITPPSGPASPQPADVPPEVCKLQATPSQPATPPASSHQTTDAPVPPKRKQGKNGKSGKGKK